MFAYFGIISFVWMVVGVTLAGIKYTGYSHSKQFCSELGAIGSPTQKLSPLINNYPLGLFFCLFGLHILQIEQASILLTLIGSLIIIHGIGTWVAGYFPMDADPYTQNPSRACQIHSWAGMFMLLSLLLAPLLSIFTNDFSMGFRLFSATCLFFAIYFTVTLKKAYEQKTNPGLHQRLSYAAQLIWLAGLSANLVYSG
ncbi:DUF998 domain-containing protein [Microbulbifer sp. SSSA002]|uniref:DUF998 domain-containing protein n=1 Tax=Microbulbifer sp. SSSA002 TaxID=3243376 RepID=UPI00403A6F05